VSPAETVEPAVILRPRTIKPGAPPASAAVTVVRPRTIGALGRPDPIALPPADALSDPTWRSTTGSVPIVGDDLDPDVWAGQDLPPPTGVKEADGLELGEPVTVGGGPAPRLLRNNLLVASGTALSRTTGMVRTALIVVFLARTLADSYLLANNTPNIIYELILGGVLTATLVPLFSDDLENGDGSATAAIVSFTVVVLMGLALLTAVLSPGLMYLYSLGSPQALRGDFRATGVRLAVLFAPQVFFYGLMALWSAVLNARHRFFAAAWAPVLNNLLVIGVLISAYRSADGKPTVDDLLDRPALLLLLGLGTTAGIAIMALSLYPALRRSGTRLRFKFQPRHPAVRRAARLSLWTFGYVIANQIAGLVVSVLAKPASGGVRDYQTAFQFFQLPHGVLAVSIMVTFEPMLGRAQARSDRRDFNDQLLLGFRLIGLLMLPAAVGYVALPTSLSASLNGGGGPVAEVLTVAGIVSAFAVGLPGYSTYIYALRGFYAMKDTRTPFRLSCLENAINIVAAVVLVRIFGVPGLALSLSFAYTVSAVVAVRILAHRSPGFDTRGLLTSWLKLVVAGAVMGALVYGLIRVIGPTGQWAVGLSVAAAIVVGAVTYFGSVYVLRVPGISEAMRRLPGLKRLTA